MEKIRHLYEDLSLIAKLNKTPGFDPEVIKSKIAYRDLSRKAQEPASEQACKSNETSLGPEVPPPPPEAVTEVFIASNEAEETFSVEPSEQDSSKLSDFQSTPDKQEVALEEDAGADTPQPEVVQPPVVKEEVKPRQTETLKEPAPAPSLADKFVEDKKSIKDIFADNKTDNSIGQRLQQSQIADLKSGIGINDKFLFINELFKGDLAGYNKAIEALNHYTDRTQALAKLEQIRSDFAWSEQSASYQRFSEFLKRRYPH